MPNDKIRMSKKFQIEFIELYRQQSCLWNREDHYYFDKCRKDIAFDILTNKMKEVYQNANRDDTIKKINMYRSTFKRELKRREKSANSGLFSSYKPRLWYFNYLLFLRDVKTVSFLMRPTDSYFDSQEVEGEGVGFGGGGVREYDDPEDEPPCVAGLSDSMRSMTIAQRQHVNVPRRRLHLDELVLDVVQNVGNKLRLMPRHKVPVVGRLIDDLLHETRLRQLHRFTRVELRDETPSSGQQSSRPGRRSREAVADEDEDEQELEQEQEEEEAAAY